MALSNGAHVLFVLPFCLYCLLFSPVVSFIEWTLRDTDTRKAAMLIGCADNKRLANSGALPTPYPLFTLTTMDLNFFTRTFRNYANINPTQRCTMQKNTSVILEIMLLILKWEVISCEGITRNGCECVDVCIFFFVISFLSLAVDFACFLFKNDVSAHTERDS